MRIAGVCLLLLASFSLPAVGQDTKIDFPGAADWPAVQRPTRSIISGSMHIDRDEFEVPLGAFVDSKFAKTVTASGAVDELAYSGPPTTSTLANHEDVSAQLVKAGYKPVFTCIRKACGGYKFGSVLAQPLIDSLHDQYGGLNVNTFSATTDDVRYTAFQRGSEYVCLLTTLAPGTYSGVLLIHVGKSMTAEQS